MVGALGFSRQHQPLSVHRPHTWDRLDMQLCAEHGVSLQETNADGVTDLSTNICDDAPATKEYEATLTHSELLIPVIVKQ